MDHEQVPCERFQLNQGSFYTRLRGEADTMLSRPTLSVSQKRKLDPVGYEVEQARFRHRQRERSEIDGWNQLRSQLETGLFNDWVDVVHQILNRPGGGFSKPRLTSKSGRSRLADELLDEKARRFALQHTDPHRVRASTQTARDNQELLCGVREHLPNDEALFLVMRAVFRNMRERLLDDA